MGVNVRFLGGDIELQVAVTYRQNPTNADLMDIECTDVANGDLVSGDNIQQANFFLYDNTGAAPATSTNTTPINTANKMIFQVNKSALKVPNDGHWTLKAIFTPTNAYLNGRTANSMVYNMRITPAVLFGGTNYDSDPTISSFTPTTAGTGATVQIFGRGFEGATAVTFGGTGATSFLVISDTEIQAVVAAGTTGSVVVTTPDGTATKTGFTHS